MSELTALREVAICARLWMEYVEKNGGNYQPEHARWIKAALDNLDSVRTAGSCEDSKDGGTRENP